MKKTLILISALSIFSACSDEDFDINYDPDNLSPKATTLALQLPAGMAGIAGAQGAYYTIFGGFWAQYYTQSNSASQYRNIDAYSAGTNDYNRGWSAMYDGLGDLRNVKRKALEQSNWKYYLIATTLEVHASQLMTDFYGDIPYAEANQQDILEPKFNTGPEVYNLMIADLKKALANDLASSRGEIPGSDDFVFGGNMANWKAYANTLLLKLYMRQTKINPTLAQAEITNLINSGVAFLDTDAAITQFEDAPNRSNPFYETDRRKLNVATNIRASTTMYSFLLDNNDPRRDNFYGPGGALDQGDFENSTITSSSVAILTLAATDPLYFMSRTESLFLQAEALARYFGGAGAKEKYDAGVLEAFQRYSKDGASFIAAGGDYVYPNGTLDENIKTIMTQKWMSGFPANGFEAFFDQNRTGYPKISTAPQSDDGYIPGEWAYSLGGITGGLFPKRIVYPNSVKTRNRFAPNLEAITKPVWWAAN
ncbi:MAG TPA: SusD/RagB family nutrient-binding outer membrane lipoprotein [Flavobacterium sp.]